MLLRLKEVMFNHDKSSATNDALNIRRSETDFVTVPEWRRGMTVNPEDSPAAYAIDKTHGKTLTIQAKFSCAEGGTPELEVRALDARLNPVRGFHLNDHGPVGWLLRYHLRNLAGNVLGEVAAKSVPACTSETGFVTFELKDVRIEEVGVGAHDVVWRWQYRLPPDGDWTDFDTSAHRIYTVLRTPEPPWQQQPYEPSNTLLPWADALDRACAWAAGAKNTDDAAELVTRGANDLGAARAVRYDGSAHYSDDRNFNCHAFLDRLRGKIGNGPCVNCDDCAAVVYTFSNILGCRLTKMSIEPIKGLASLIEVKPIIEIGIPGWREEKEFDYHVVASEGSCREVDEVFDACFQVATVDEPIAQKRVPLLVNNLRFGGAGETSYRSRLVTEEFQSKCRIDPEDCKVTKPGPAHRLAAHCQDRLRAVKERHAFDGWAFADAPGVKRFVLGYFFADNALEGWRPVQLREFGGGEGEEEPPAIQSFWERKTLAGSQLLRADVFECASWVDARKGVAALLTWFQEPVMKRREGVAPGDVVFADDAFSTVLSAVGNIVFFLRNTCKDDARLWQMAETLSGTVLNPPPETISAADLRPRAAGQFRFETREGRAGRNVLIEQEAQDPLARRRSYQFFSDEGEVSWRDGKLYYRPKASGGHSLEVFSIDTRHDAFRQELTLEVR